MSVKKVLRDIKDTACLDPLVACYLDEVYSDGFATAAYLNFYNLLMMKALLAKQLEVHKQNPFLLHV